MAGNVEGVRSFLVKIDVGASYRHCTAYFKRLDLINSCEWCKGVPDILYSPDNNSKFCKSCFSGRMRYQSAQGPTKTETHQQMPASVKYNAAFLDAEVECPVCRRKGPYLSLKDHIVEKHPELLNSGQQQQPSDVQLADGVRPPPGFPSKQQAVEKREKEPQTKDESRSYTVCRPPEEAKTKTTYDCEMQVDENCSQSSQGTAGEGTEKPGNSDSHATDCMIPSIFLDPNHTEEQTKHTLLMFLECKKWFQTQLLKYYDEHLKDCYNSEEESAKYLQDHVEKCPRVPSMHVNWLTKALSKYRELRNKQCLGCTEGCSSFLEHGKHCEEFLQEVKTLSTDEMFEFYQQHVNNYCPGSIHANDTIEKTPSNCEQIVPEKEADQDGKPVIPNPDKLPENLQREQTVAQEHLQTFAKSPEAEVGGNTEAPAEGRVCPTCFEAWDSQEIAPEQHEVTTDESYRKQIELLREEIRRLQEENKGLLTTVEGLESSQETNCNRMAKFEEEVRSASLQRLKFEELLTKQRKEFEKLKKDFEELASGEEKNKERTEAENCVRRLKTELHMDWLLPVFQHIWKLQPYSALRKSLLFNNATLSTGVLSVNTPGYKIELMIRIKGDYREWRRQWLKDESNCSVPVPHLALMLRIHQGEDDNLLAWPFRNKITMLLVNHLDENKSKLLELSSEDADADCFNKPVRGALNAVFGFPRVISLPDLENLDGGFLFQDCIVFKFTVHRRE